eukprot:scaffold87075_cov39-Phaeocystis_antarctica.AAC.1
MPSQRRATAGAPESRGWARRWTPWAQKAYQACLGRCWLPGRPSFGGRPRQSGRAWSLGSAKKVACERKHVRKGVKSAFKKVTVCTQEARR